LADDAADDTRALQEAIDTGRPVRLDRGRYVISGELRLKANGQQLQGAGLAETVLAARGDFSVCVRADGLRGVAVRDLTIDADREGRRPVLRTRTLGVFLVDCTDGRVERCRVTGTVGGPVARGGRNLPGVGIALDHGRRCLIADCLVEDCGTKVEREASDAIYTSGETNLVRDCVARRCTDTAFVVEDSVGSGVVRCQAESCSAGLAITSAGDRPSRDNYAARVVIRDWDAAVTGGVSVGCPVASGRGDLLDTTLADIIIERRDGRGPALAVRRTGPARVIGLTVRGARVRGAGTQGILLDAERVRLRDCEVADTGWTAIQVQPGCRDVIVRDCTVSRPTRFGITVLGGASGVLLADNRVRGARGRMEWGIFLFPGAGPVVIWSNSVEGASAGEVHLGRWGAGGPGRGTGLTDGGTAPAETTGTGNVFLAD
jgi:hypothetical protein